MTNSDASFAGSIPGIYHSSLGPMFFEPYARDIAKRLTAQTGDTILEIAAGTGIVTRHLLERLPSGSQLIATDLNDAMIEIGKTHTGLDPRLRWEQADAAALPFPDVSIDGIVCQFGLMFFPDKVAALREARRVLKPGGALLFNTWGALADNPIAQCAHDVIASFFQTDPPQFFTVPFGLHDKELVKQILRDAGFTSVNVDGVDENGTSATALVAAKGLIYGTPVINQIQERGRSAPDAIMQAVADRLSRAGGAQPLRLPMRALVFTAS
ncbi:MAG: class I SAM-dependent methyltransferase [Acidobacteria bacterium]|nr:class I SAM-dependent methyltransferase [Acidobacteriota bacterium]